MKCSFQAKIRAPPDLLCPKQAAVKLKCQTDSANPVQRGSDGKSWLNLEQIYPLKGIQLGSRNETAQVDVKEKLIQDMIMYSASERVRRKGLLLADSVGRSIMNQLR
jgi:hypothetical protein